MKIAKLGILVFLSLFIFGFSKLPVVIGANETEKNIGFFEDEKKIFNLINVEREKKRLDSLIWNSQLAGLARSYSQKMARERFFSHFDKDGKSIEDRAKAMRITKWKLIGENLFMCDGYENFAQVAVKGWMKSPGHRENILETKFNQTGIGIATSKDGTIYITEVFVEN